MVDDHIRITPTATEGPATVLVADDNAAKRYLTVRWLQRAGFLTTETENGAETLEAVVTRRPDLVVLDVRLPDMSGFEVCRRIKRDARTGHIPVLHLSAHVNTIEDRVAGLEGGADGYLNAPVEAEELIATVKALLRIRRTERALRESEERFRLVARATNDVVWDWNLATSEVRWNEAAQMAFRRAASEIGSSARWWYEHIHPDDRDRVVAGLRAVIDGQGELWTEEYRILRGDGTYMVVFDRGYVAHDENGVPCRMIGSMLDITERKRNQQEQQFLAEASTALAETLDPRATLRAVARMLAPGLADICAVYYVDADAPLLPLHVAAAGALDTDRVESVLREYGEHSKPGVQNAIARAIAHGSGALVPGDYQEPGTPSPLDVLPGMGMASGMVVPLRAHDHIIGALLLARDGSTGPFTRNEFHLVEELSTRVALAVDNGRLYEQALVADRAKADFLAVMSHELRTPLNAVIGYSDLLLLGIPGPLSTESQQYVQRVQLCARQLLQLIEQILSYSRMESGRDHLRIERVEVNTLLRDTATLVGPLVQEKGLRFDLESLPRNAAIRSDPAKLRQILLNLLSNAVKFTDGGTVHLSARVTPTALEFVVRDSGLGISSEHHERIFEPFWQVEQRKTRRAGGSGLGLAISRRLARLLGGDIQLQSTVGQGSAFTLVLPRTVLEEQAEIAERATA